jgi:electron transfer flavoprotein alpha subunit
MIDPRSSQDPGSLRLGLRVHREATSLPNLLVPIDLRNGEPTGPSLFALSEARRIAQRAGATIYAIAMSDRELPPQVVSGLGRAGADKVILCEGAGLDAPPLEATHGPALLAAVERVPPLLVLFPAGGAGLELGPSLAARIGGAFAARADLVVADTAGPLSDGVGRVFLRRWRSDRSSYRRLDPVEIERPVVALLASGEPTDHAGAAEVDVEVIACPPPAQDGIVEISSEPDETAEVSLSRVLVVVDSALGDAALIRLRAAAPRGVVVVDRGASAAAIAASVPDILIGVGHADLPMVGTPRGRVGVILFGDAVLPPRALADVLWRAPANPDDVVWEDLARALGSLVGSGSSDDDGARRRGRSA